MKLNRRQIHRTINSINIVVLATLLTFNLVPLVYADTRVDIKIENTHFLAGLNLTDDQGAASIGVDWSHDSGFFTGLNCYASNVDGSNDLALARGCLGYVGYFLSLGKEKKREQALAFSVRQFELPDLSNQAASFTEAVVDWHIKRNIAIEFSGSDNWMGRGFKTWAVNSSFSKDINANLSTIFNVGVLGLESTAPVNSIEFASVGLQYRLNRWTGEFKVLHADDDLTIMTGIEVSQPEVSFSLSYQIY